MEWMAPVGLLLALVLIIFLAMRGGSILVIGPVCSLLVILTNKMDIGSALVTAPNSYMAGVGNFMSRYFLIFLLGAVLAKYMEDSGAARAIAGKLLKLTGTEKPFNILLAIFLVSAVLTYGGVSLYVAIFAIVPLARPLFREMNIPLHLMMPPIALGVGTFTMTMLPGTPSIQNAIPATTLGTPMTAAPVLGLAGTVVTVLFGIWYMKSELTKAGLRGEKYVVSSADSAQTNKEGLPSVTVSSAPLLVLIAIILVGSFMKMPNIILPALFVAILVAAAAFNKHISNHVATLNGGATSAVTPAILTAAAVGFGIVITAAPGFKIIAKLIMDIPGSPLISLSVATSLMAAVTGSSTGSLGIILESFGKAYIAKGINPEIFHRIAAMASGPLSAMPHSGAVLALLALTGLTHKDGYKHIFMTVVVGSLLSLILAVVLAVAF